jgi:hypothetical protein
MSSTILLPPRAQLCIRYCSNKHTHTLTVTQTHSEAHWQAGPGAGLTASQSPPNSPGAGLTASQSPPNAHVPGKYITTKYKVGDWIEMGLLTATIMMDRRTPTGTPPYSHVTVAVDHSKQRNSRPFLGHYWFPVFGGNLYQCLQSLSVPGKAIS